MKVIEYILEAQERKNPFFSFEILPPLKGNSIDSIYEGIDPLMEFNPKFVNVTYHREEFKYEKKGDTIQKIAIRKRPGTVGICAAIMNKYKVDTIPHLVCGGFTKEETEDALIDLYYIGIENVLALRGDALKSDPSFIATPGGNKYAEELVTQISNMNEGRYLHSADEILTSTNFCIGAAGYPEKHFEALSTDSDLNYLKAKVEAGAEYIVTQMFFDNQKYFEYVQKCRSVGINVPILPGLKPLTTLKQIEMLPNIFHISLPESFRKELQKCKTNEAVKEVGIEWSILQSKELVKSNVPGLHFYTMSKSESVKRITESIF